MDKTAWKAARADLDAIEKERDALTQRAREVYEATTRIALAPTVERYELAKAKLIEVEEVTGEPFGFCEGCSEPIFDGEPHHSGSDAYLCAGCAPTYADMQASPGTFVDPDENPLTPAAAAEIVAGHIAAGGGLTDPIV